MRRRSIASPSCPSRPALAPSSAGSERRTLRPLRGKERGQGWGALLLPLRVPDARVRSRLSPPFAALK